MKKLILICMLIALAATTSTAKSPKQSNTDLTGVWKVTITNVFNGNKISETHTVFYFFDDNTYVADSANSDYGTILTLKNQEFQKWNLISGNLILFDKYGKQGLTMFSKKDIVGLLNGVKLINGIHQLPETVPTKLSDDFLVYIP